MAIARKKHDWEQIALQTTILANCWTSKNSRLQVTDFPYCGKPEQRIDTPEKFKLAMELFLR